MNDNEDEFKQYFRIKNDYIINESLCFATIEEVLNGRVLLDFDVYLPSLGMNLQRDFVWSQFKKEQFIISFFKKIYIPPYAVVQSDLENNRRHYEIVDGKQRFSTLIAYAKNEFSIKLGEKNYFLSELPARFKIELLSRLLVANVAYKGFITDAQKVEWFNFINFAGVPADVEHQRRLEVAISKNR